MLQDTPDYVAYVAKDPVNQRGMFCKCLSSSSFFFKNLYVKLCLMQLMSQLASSYLTDAVKSSSIKNHVESECRSGWK